MNLSNCHLRAWKYFRRGEARKICFEFTEYSHVRPAWVASWAWRYTLGLCGLLLQALVWPLAHLAEMLRSGRWYHVSWVRAADGETWEYVPDRQKALAWLPPILFHGIERRAT